MRLVVSQFAAAAVAQQCVGSATSVVQQRFCCWCCAVVGACMVLFSKPGVRGRVRTQLGQHCFGNLLGAWGTSDVCDRSRLQAAGWQGRIRP
jgi:hypothetical protein